MWVIWSEKAGHDTFPTGSGWIVLTWDHAMCRAVSFSVLIMTVRWAPALTSSPVSSKGISVGVTKENSAFRLFDALVESTFKTRFAGLMCWIENQECFVDTHSFSFLSSNGSVLSSNWALSRMKASVSCPLVVYRCGNRISLCRCKVLLCP